MRESILYKNNYKIYTAGPMTGLKHDDVCAWRHYLVQELSPVGVKVKSPLRGTEHMQEEYAATGSDKELARNEKEIFIRDRIDCTTADVLVVNLLDATKASIGTMHELAWAHILRIPTVVIRKPGCVHDHLFVNQSADFTCETVEQAADIVKDILDVRG